MYCSGWTALMEHQCMTFYRYHESPQIESRNCWSLDWMLTTNPFGWYRHLASRSKNTSLDRLRTYSHPVTDEDHVCQTCRGVPRGQNRDIHLTFSGLRMQHATGTTSRLPSLALLCCTRQLYTTTETRCELGIYQTRLSIKWPMLRMLRCFTGPGHVITPISYKKHPVPSSYRGNWYLHPFFFKAITNHLYNIVHTMYKDVSL